MHIPDGFLDLKTSVASAALALGGVGWAIREANRHLPAARRPVMGLAAVWPECSAGVPGKPWAAFARI